MRRLLLLATALVAAPSAWAGVASQLDTPVLRPLGDALAVSIAKSLPVPAASSGITFTFDPATSAFERDTEVLGQLFLERARPIGRGRLNVSFTYQYVDVTTYDGHSLRSLSDLQPIRDPATGASFVIPHFDVRPITHEMTTSVTWGVTDDADVNLTIPVLYTHLRTSGYALQLGSPPVRQPGSADEDALGVGDIFLRGKWRFLHGRFGDVAAALVFRLPSGNESDLQGTGLFEVDPYLYASTPVVALAPLLRAQAFVNAGLDLTPQESSQGEGRFGVGVDIMLATRATLSVAFLGREPFGRLLPPGATDVPRTNGTRTPLFGIDPGHPSYYDVAVGLRVNLWADTVFGMANVLVPANRDGLRASVIPLVGIEAAF